MKYERFPHSGRDDKARNRTDWIGEKPMSIYTLIFRVKGGDVYEQPVEAKSYAGSVRRALSFHGLRRADIIMCVGIGELEPRA